MDFLDKPPEAIMNDVKLVIVNLYATFFLKSLAANCPTILFCDRNIWKLSNRALKFYDELHDAGIFHYNPISLANMLNETWPNIYSWWYSDKIQNARKNFCNEFANRSDSWFKEWIKFVWKLQ